MFDTFIARDETRDLCEETGCNMLTKNQMDQMIYLSRLKKAKDTDKLNKIWKEIKVRNYSFSFIIIFCNWSVYQIHDFIILEAPAKAVVMAEESLDILHVLCVHHFFYTAWKIMTDQ